MLHQIRQRCQMILLWLFQFLRMKDRTVRYFQSIIDKGMGFKVNLHKITKLYLYIMLVYIWFALGYNIIIGLAFPVYLTGEAFFIVV